MVRTMFGFAKRGLALALLAGLAACQAADGTSQAPDVAMVDSVMKGLGAVNPNEKPIDYKPRAPLAMPAEPGKLPEPETNVAGANSENWPQQRENQELTDLKAIYASAGKGGSMNSEPLTPEQMRGFKITGTPTDRDLVAERRDNEITEGDTLTRAEQRAEWERLQQLKSQQAGVDQNGLAQRRFLTEPPTGYSTPSPDAPMPEVVKKNNRKPTNYDQYDSKPLDPRCLEGQSEFCR